MAMRPRLMWLCLAFVFRSPAQPPAAKFEVVSVRLSPPESTGFNARITADNSRVNYTGISLSSVLRQAFGLENVDQLSAPAWLNDISVDIHATLPPGTSKARAAEMMQTLLAERFGLQYHREQRPTLVDRLKTIQGAPHLAPASDDEPDKPAEFSGDRGYYIFRKSTMDGFAQALNTMRLRPFGPFRDLNRNVINSTGLEGKYDFALNFGSGSDDTRSVTQALKDIGLRLEPDKIPVEYIIVDQMAKTPTPN